MRAQGPREGLPRPGSGGGHARPPCRSASCQPTCPPSGTSCQTLPGGLAGCVTRRVCLSTRMWRPASGPLLAEVSVGSGCSGLGDSPPPHGCALPPVDREGGRLAGQGVPAGRPLQARVGGGRQHAAPLALPRAEVLLPHLRGSAHRGALQHHPRSAPPARGTFPAPLFFSSWQGVLWGADLGLGVLSRAGPSPGSGAWSLFWAGPLGSSGLALGITLSPRGGGGQVCGRRKREGCTRPEQAPCRSPQRPGCSLWAAAERLSTCTVCACPCACARTRPLPTDFPDSRPAIEDLKYCLERTDQRQQLLVSLKAALETRLLHPGPPRLPARPSSRGPDPGARGPGSQPRGLRRVG